MLTWWTNIGGAILSLGSILIVARELGPEGRGHVALLTAIALLLGNLATAGVQEANANFAAKDPSTRRALATNSLLLALVLGAIAAGALALLLWAVPDAVGDDTSGKLLWATVAFVPLIILEIYLLYLAQADYAFVVTNLAMLLAPAVAFTGNALFALTDVLTVRNAIAVWLAGQAASTTLLVWFVARRLAGFGRADLGLARRSLGFGLRAYVGRVMQLGNYRLDQWLLGAISGTRALGLYSVAVAWAEALWYLPTALAAVQRPDLVRSDSRTAGERAARVFRGSILVTAISAVLMIALAPFLCTVDLRGTVPRLGGPVARARPRRLRDGRSEAAGERARGPRPAGPAERRRRRRLHRNRRARRAADPAVRRNGGRDRLLRCLHGGRRDHGGHLRPPAGAAISRPRS